MVDTITIVGITALSILIIGLVVWIVYILMKQSGERQATGPSRIELYFAENFRNLVDEWDLQSRGRIKTWRTDMTKRLNTVGSEIERLKTFQKTMDTRLDRLKREMVKLEKL